jgi:hypothetical protein
MLTFVNFPKVAISDHLTVDQAQTLIEVQSLNYQLNRPFYLGAVFATYEHVLHTLRKLNKRFIIHINFSWKEFAAKTARPEE